MNTPLDKIQPGAAIRISGAQFGRPVGKRLDRNADGTGLSKTLLSDERSSAADVVNLSFETPSEAFDFLLNCLPETMLFSGTFPKDLTSDRVVPKYILAQALCDFSPGEMPDLVTATKENLAHRQEPGVIVIDIDKPRPIDDGNAVWPPEGQPLLASADAVEEAMLSLLPELLGCPMLIMPSSGSMIIEANSGNMLAGPGGWHVYIVISDARQIPRILELIHLRAWAKGVHRHALVSAVGSVLTRSLADLAMARPTQPNFLIADLGPGLDFASGGAKTCNVDGPYFDPDTAVLAVEDREAAAARIAEARAELRPVVAKVKVMCKAAHVTRAVARGVPRPVAQRAAERKFDAGVLPGSDVVIFDDGVEVPVAKLLGAEGASFDGRLCLDPVEPGYDGGRSVAKFFWNNGRRAGVHSFAHGSKFYRLQHDADTAAAALEASNGDKNIITEALALADLDPIDARQLERLATKLLGLGNNLTIVRSAVQQKKAEIAASYPQGDSSETASDPLLSTSLGEALDRVTFPKLSMTDKGPRIVDHQDNVAHLLKSYGITFTYDLISKEFDFNHVELQNEGDHAAMSLQSLLVSLCALNGVPDKNLSLHLTALGSANSVNPVVQYLSSLKWDGSPRFRALADAMEADDIEIARIAIRILLLQACAAADHAEIGRSIHSEYVPHFESVVVFTGGQGIGKTKGARKLLPRALRKYFKESVALDLRDKDSRKAATSSWITEFGELEGTFRRSDIAGLKAFLSQEVDEIRMPYAVKASRLERRTNFIATVNETQFLADQTGNRRFVPLSVTRVDPGWSDEEVDQIWAEAWARYIAGDTWWATSPEEDVLARNAERYRIKPEVEEAIEAEFEWGQPPDFDAGRLTASKITSLLPVAGSGFDLAIQKTVGHAVRRLWQQSGLAEFRNGAWHALGPEGEWVKLNSDGGKNKGWLMPPRKRKHLAELLAKASGPDGRGFAAAPVAAPFGDRPRESVARRPPNGSVS